jgi:hypothetical protein
MQMDLFLKEFSNKATLAQENIGKLVNQQTLSSRLQEIEAYTMLKKNSRRFAAIFKSLKINIIYKQICKMETIAGGSY